MSLRVAKPSQTWRSDAAIPASPTGGSNGIASSPDGRIPSGFLAMTKYLTPYYYSLTTYLSTDYTLQNMKIGLR